MAGTGREDQTGENWTGNSLCRSGEELELKKTIDRFTLALTSSDVLAQLEAKLNAEVEAEVLQTLPGIDLIEFRVAPDRLEDAMRWARECQAVKFVSHVYAMSWNAGALIYLTSQMTVQFTEAVNPADIMQTIAHDLGLQVVKLIPGISKAFVFEVTQRATVNPLKLAHQLMSYAEILLAEPNVAISIRHYPVLENEENAESRELLPADPLACQEDIKATESLTQGDRSIVIAMAEEAIDWQYPGWRGMGKLVAPVEFDGGRQRAAKGDEANEEGQEVPSSVPCSLLSTLNNIAPNCALMPMAIGRWLDDQLVEQICQWAIDHGAAVLVCSWGADANYFPLSLRQRVALSRTATQGRAGKGCVVIWAAGADDRLVVQASEQSESNDFQHSTQWLNGFAVHPDVITVAACTKHSRATHGNWSTGISICAESDRGTGTASAIVAGIVALMLSVNPDLTVRTVRRILQDTADRILDPNSPSGLQGGYDALGYSQKFGYGRVNAHRAIDAAWQRAKSVEYADRWIEQQNTSPLAIPDGDPQGICSAIGIENSGLIKSIEISVEIAHSLMGDIEIFLISPTGTAILLQNRTLGRITLLRKTYSFETTPSLKILLNHVAAGQWQLQVIDRVRLNTGQLKQWQLRLGVGKL